MKLHERVFHELKLSFCGATRPWAEKDGGCRKGHRRKGERILKAEEGEIPHDMPLEIRFGLYGRADKVLKLRKERWYQ